MKNNDIRPKKKNSLEEKEECKRAYIATYCTWTSYGSIFQSFALQKTLDDLNVRSYIIQPASEPEAVYIIPTWISLSIKSIIKRLMNRSHIKEDINRYFKNNSFISKKIRCIYLKDYESLVNSPITQNADIYIAGSDQVWNPVLMRKDFFLDFPTGGKRKISYAASMGLVILSDKQENEFRKLISNFDAISVREFDMIPLIRKYTSKDIYHNVDPTFLINKEEWVDLEVKYKGRKFDENEYILVYALYWDPVYNDKLHFLQKKTGYKIVSVQDSVKNIYANEKLYDVGPGEFLWLVHHAKAVITSSFHGTALSIIYNKKLSIVRHPTNNSRIDSLLRLFGMENPSIEDCLEVGKIDYTKINKIIRKEQLKSVEYLRNEIYAT